MRACSACLLTTEGVRRVIAPCSGLYLDEPSQSGALDTAASAAKDEGEKLAEEGEPGDAPAASARSPSAMAMKMRLRTPRVSAQRRRSKYTGAIIGHAGPFANGPRGAGIDRAAEPRLRKSYRE